MLRLAASMSIPGLVAQGVGALYALIRPAKVVFTFAWIWCAGMCPTARRPVFTGSVRGLFVVARASASIAPLEGIERTVKVAHLEPPFQPTILRELFESSCFYVSRVGRYCSSRGPGLSPGLPSPRCCRSRLSRGSLGLICQRTVVLSVLETPCGFLPAVACFPAASACAAACGLPCSVRFAVSSGSRYSLASARAVRVPRRW